MLYADCTSNAPLECLVWDIREERGVTTAVIHFGTGETVKALRRHAKKHPLPTLEEVKAGKGTIEI